ncbi:MADF domain-containing protein [Caenorhabditis elegans]|uniref:MADF domain-containing protein n=1 Tax=Caenorhabditis elegans TaxID=6239 RepID=Q21395_CAEEL|nr:MADF domain-containing protein [Caenorhabditis elegans]CCD63627.1 MADF domain-containing protein [Caenorhabditis elegans]|eukprot:NP_510769.1 LIn-8 Domain containing [Caenorhabditis elegans]
MTPNTERSITMQKNIELGKTKSGRYSKKRVNVKKALFKIVENYPNIWKSKSSGPPDEWRQIVMEVFKQTGEIVRESILRVTLSEAKRYLKVKIVKCIKKKMDHNSMESHLRQWIFFPYFRYYYNTLGKFESEKRSQVSTGSSVDSQLVDDTFGDDMEMDDDCEEGDNDDIVFVEEVIHEQYLNDCVQEVKPQHTAIALPPSPLLANNRTPSMSHFARFSEESMAREISWEDQAPKGAKENAPSYEATEKFASSITSQIYRLFEENAEKSKLIKDVLQKTILALDDTNAYHRNSCDVFEELLAVEEHKLNSRSGNNRR